MEPNVLEVPELRPSWTVSEAVIGCALRVHRALGPGLLESTYGSCLAHEMALAGVAFEREVALPVRYRGFVLETGYRLDFLVSGELVLEVKSVDALSPVHEAQLATYLKFSGKRIGLLLNFNVRMLKDGLHRIIK